jgi:hypothetical protein
MARIEDDDALNGFIELLTHGDLHDDPSDKLDEREAAVERASLALRAALETETRPLGTALGRLVFEDPDWLDTYSTGQIADVLSLWLTAQDASRITADMARFVKDPQHSEPATRTFVGWLGGLVAGWQKTAATPAPSPRGEAAQHAENRGVARWPVPGTERRVYRDGRWLYGGDQPTTDWLPLEERYRAARAAAKTSGPQPGSVNPAFTGLYGTEFRRRTPAGGYQYSFADSSDSGDWREYDHWLTADERADRMVAALAGITTEMERLLGSSQ